MQNNRSFYFIKFEIIGILTSVILFYTSNLFSQNNLVPNGSFENHGIFPNYGMARIDSAKYWFQPNKGEGSSDLFNTCNNSVPFFATYQYPKLGNGYAGISLFTDPNVNNSNNWREYIEVGLTDSLKRDKKYCVRFYTNKGNWSNYAIKNIQAVLTNDSLFYNDPNYSYITGVTSIMEADSVITDTLNWISIETTYTAHGGERFLTIGNFSSGANTVYKYVWPFGGTPSTLGYYLIDDVSVTLCDTTQTHNSSNPTVPNAFSPNNDGHNDVFTLKGWKNYVTEFTIIIYNRWGEKVFESNDPEIAWDGTYNGKLMDAAVFAYYINATSNSGEKIIRKGNISLIR